jgi:hypothetical protein
VHDFLFSTFCLIIPMFFFGTGCLIAKVIRDA